MAPISSHSTEREGNEHPPKRFRPRWYPPPFRAQNGPGKWRMSEVSRVIFRSTRSVGSGTPEAIACSDANPDGAVGETPGEHNQGDD